MSKKSFLGLFTVETDDKLKDEPKTSTPVQPIISQSYPINQGIPQPPVQQTVVSPDASLSDKFNKYFNDLFDKSDFPGPDYHEFKRLVEKLMTKGLSEPMAIVAAFEALNAQGMTKEVLLSTAQKYIDILSNDTATFTTELKKKEAEKVTQKETQISALQLQNDENNRQIAKLTEQIQTNFKSINDLQNEITVNKQEIHNREVSYSFAQQAFLLKINTDIQKITSNIQ